MKSITDAPWSASLSDTPHDLSVKIGQAVTDMAGVDLLFIPGNEWVVEYIPGHPSNSWVTGVPGVSKLKIANSNNLPNTPGIHPINSSVKNARWSHLIVDGNHDGRFATPTVGTQRPGGSGVSTNGESDYFYDNIESINWPLHCFDLCCGGEIQGGSSYYVKPANRVPELFPYYPANMSKGGVFNHCKGSNPGDDIFTIHYSEGWTLINPTAKDGSLRHPSSHGQGTSVGIEICAGSRNGKIFGGTVKNVLGGVVYKCHDGEPAPQGCIAVGLDISDCAQSLGVRSPYNPGTPDPSAFDIAIDNVIIRNPKQHPNNPDKVKGVVVFAYQGVKIENLLVKGRGNNGTGNNDVGQLIEMGDHCNDIIIRGSVHDWFASMELITKTVSVLNSSVDMKVRNCSTCSISKFGDRSPVSGNLLPPGTDLRTILDPDVYTLAGSYVNGIKGTMTGDLVVRRRASISGGYYPQVWQEYHAYNNRDLWCTGRNASLVWAAWEEK